MPAYFPPIQALASVAHRWVNAISGAGVATATQPTASDLSDTVAPTAWTPTDQSGASLTLTNNGSIYYRIGKLVAATIDVTYPASPASAAQGLISLPVTTTSNGNLTNFSFNGVVQNSGAGALYWGSAAGSATVAIFSSQNLGPASNNTLASLRLRLTVTYFTD